MPDLAWELIVPVKERRIAKSRLHPPAGLKRADLAHAFALDTVAVAAMTVGAGHLWVVTADEGVLAATEALGAHPVRDPGGGLNPAIEAGLEQVRRARADRVAVLLGDLPALRVADLREALEVCAAHEGAFVPDAEGTGTVLLTSQRPAVLEPRFGAGSAAAHADSGVRLELDLPRLRGDVDDDAGLQRARALGVGPHTAAVLRAWLG